MNTYLIPVFDDECYIHHVYARSTQEAKDKIVEDFIETYELEDDVESWEDLLAALDGMGILIGDIYDKEEF